MKKNIELKISSKFTYYNEIVDNIDYQGKGILYEKNKAIYLIYEEKTKGLKGIKTAIKIYPDEKKLILSRSAIIALHFVFAEDNKNLSYYQTTEGKIFFDIKTHKIVFEIDNYKGKILLDYSLFQSGEKLLSNKLQINYKIL